MTARQRWKAWYRQFRIIRRETSKACEDMILYGTGCVTFMNDGDFIQHVPIQNVRFYT